MSSDTNAPPAPPRLKWTARVLFGLVVLIGAAVVYFANAFLTERFVETTRDRAELRQQLYSGAILS